MITPKKHEIYTQHSMITSLQMSNPGYDPLRSNHLKNWISYTGVKKAITIKNMNSMCFKELDLCDVNVVDILLIL